MNSQTPVTSHAIFDLGQILLDLSPVVCFLEEYARSKGKDMLEVFDDLSEMDSTEQYLQIFFNSLNDENSPDKFEDFVKELSAKCFSNGFPLVSGVDKLIRHLHRNNIPMAIASNITRDQVDSTLKAGRDLEQALFSHITAGDDPDVKDNKPAPDVFLVCFKRFTPPPKSLQNCVIFEDSFRGICGAVASGMKTVLINERKTDVFNEIADKITAIVDSFDNFRPESVGLPPYSNI